MSPIYNVIKLTTVLFVCLCFVSCVSVNNNHYTDIKLVDLKVRKEFSLSKTGMKNFFGPAYERKEDVLAVVISTDPDIRSTLLRDGTSVNLIAKVTLCSGNYNQDFSVRDAVLVFDKYGPVSGRAEKVIDDTIPNLRYNIYVFINSYGSADMFGVIDLVAQKRDLCIRLSGSKMYSNYKITSNVIRIDYKTLEKLVGG